MKNNNLIIIKKIVKNINRNIDINIKLSEHNFKNKSNKTISIKIGGWSW